MKMRRSLVGGISQIVWTLTALLAGFISTTGWAWTHTGTATVQSAMGVGTETPIRQMHVKGTNAVFRMDRDRDGPAFMLVETALGNFNSIYKTFVVSTIASGVNNGSFVINDLGTAVSGAGTRRLTIANNGLIGNTETPAAALHIRNPSTGNSLRLDSNAGTPNFYVQNDGDLYAIGADLELRLATTTAGGHAFSQPSTLLANTLEGSGEESFLALNGITATISSPGDSGLLGIVDSDTYKTNYLFAEEEMVIRTEETYFNFNIQVTNQGENGWTKLSTTGEGFYFVGDSDNDTAGFTSFGWYNNGTSNTNRLMELASIGNLIIKGTLFESAAFDLAEAYWKSDVAIEAGDVVCINPEQPNAVVLARAAKDRSVIGVVSTKPGLVMGGRSFSVGDLTELWGDDITALYVAERKSLKKRLASSEPEFKERMAQAVQLKSSLAKNVKAADAARAKAAFAAKSQQLEDDLEAAALTAFCEEHLALVAMAGRVPVKVDASYGAIGVGDLLVASATPGQAMRAVDPTPGTVIGKALEPFVSGQGAIMMMVMNR